MIRIVLTSISIFLTVSSCCACSASRSDRLATQASPSAASIASPSPRRETDDRKPEEPVSLGGGLYLVAKGIDERNARLHYEISIRYPEITGSNKAQVLRFNRLAASLATLVAREYKKFQTGPRDKLQPWWKDTKEYLSITYDVILADDRLISVRFDEQTYTRGAAHAVQQFKVINYDLEHGKQLQLGDLFTSNSQYLNVIADYCLNSLRELNRGDCLEAAKDPKSGIDRDYCKRVANTDFWLPEWGRPTSRNFQFWNLKNEGLLESFEECRMAACMAGPREVVIPYQSLKNIINPKGVLLRRVSPSAS
jgi:hypothetical protein